MARLICDWCVRAHTRVHGSEQGTSQKNAKCATCNLGVQECIGHFGYLDLELPVYHVGFFRHLIQTLQCVCKVCALCTRQRTRARMHSDALHY